MFPSGTGAEQNRTQHNNRGRVTRPADGDGRRARSTPLALPVSSCLVVASGDDDARPRLPPWFPAALRPPPPRALAQKQKKETTKTMAFGEITYPERPPTGQAHA